MHFSAKPIIRRLLTRLLGLIPSMVVAVAVGRSGIDALLVASQVALAIVLPFVTLPLICLTSSKRIMSVRKPQMIPGPGAEPDIIITDPEQAWPLVDFSSGRIATGLGFLIWLIMVVANAYVIIILAEGKGG